MTPHEKRTKAAALYERADVALAEGSHAWAVGLTLEADRLMDEAEEDETHGLPECDPDPEDR